MKSNPNTTQGRRGGPFLNRPLSVILKIWHWSATSLCLPRHTYRRDKLIRSGYPSNVRLHVRAYAGNLDRLVAWLAPCCIFDTPFVSPPFNVQVRLITSTSIISPLFFTNVYARFLEILASKYL